MKNYNKNIFNLKKKEYNNTNDYKNIGKNLNINNINNNIIINKNLNIYCNNSPQKIFKKKALGSSFSINDRNKKIKSINNSIDKMLFLIKLINQNIIYFLT